MTQSRSVFHRNVHENDGTRTTGLASPGVMNPVELLEVCGEKRSLSCIHCGVMS